MLVREMIDRLNNGDTKPNICKELGCSPATIGRRIKDLGFAYSNTAKIYEYIGEGDPPLDVVMEELVQEKPRQPSEPREKKIRPAAVRSVTSVPGESDIQRLEIRKEPDPFQFSGDEINAIKSIIQMHRQRPISWLYLQMAELPTGEKVKKSIEISSQTYELFEEYAAGIPKISKNDLLEISIQDGMRKYYNKKRPGGKPDQV